MKTKKKIYFDIYFSTTLIIFEIVLNDKHCIKKDLNKKKKKFYYPKCNKSVKKNK